MNKIGLAGLLAVCVGAFACADVTVKVPDICNTSQVGTIFPSYAKTSTLTAEVDVSQEINQINGMFDQVFLKLTSLSVTADQDLSWLQELDITIDGGTSATPETTLATYRAAQVDPGTSLPITLVMDPNTLFTYLRQPVTLTFTITGSPKTDPANFTSTFCVDLTGEINKQ